mmetsp:Transcript_39330/g.72034  ORF Transcript_39330/g.72034 Transcript_39330/m.72034 type:complete len:609 (+) Transcript_39330:66-1892(+)
MKDRSSSSLSGSGASNGAADTTNDDYNDRISQRSQRYRKVTRKRSSMPVADQAPLTATKPFLVLVALLAVALAIQFMIVFSWHHKRHDVHVLGKPPGDVTFAPNNEAPAAHSMSHPSKKDPALAHLVPHLPPLPPILNSQNIPNSKTLIDDTISGRHPTIAGISLVLCTFRAAMHKSNQELAMRKAPNKVQRDEVHERFVKLAQEHLAPLESVYRDKPIFPIREDDSIFVSLASFRDSLLCDTLKGAFDQAKNPEKLFIGAIVQNCFGLNPYPGEPGVQCRTGAQVVGKDAHGHDTTKVSDAPPDRNGIEEFCNSPEHKQYCDSGQIRVMYLHENESLGPAMARYYASKLWGGESYFMQVDSHLEFYTHWDELYTNECKSAGSFPKAILSSYPPGFQKENGGILENKPSPGARLCTCEFSDSDVEAKIIRINTGVGYSGGEEHPTQVPFIAAGFFFTPAGFLVDVPFDPYMPWCFMGEEIMLSMRAWTHGWDIYAPRKNWIAHQYRPGRMGLPKFWGSVGRLFNRPGPGFSNQLQLRLIKRVKHLVGYKDCCSREKLMQDGDELVLMDVEHYGFGDVRSREDYLKWANIDVDAKRCSSIGWCNKGELL